MKKRKFFALLLSGCLLFTACSGSGGDEDTDTSDSEQEYVTVTDEDGNTVTDENGDAVTSAVSDEPEPEKELNVGFIYSGTAGGDSVSEVFETARDQAERVLGANTYYIENVLVSQFEDATAKLVEQGCNVIVSTSARYANAVYQEAKANGKVYFISFGGDKVLSNLACFQGEMYKTAYVCGMAGAWNSSSGNLGVVADPAVLSCYNIVNGYIQGAKELTDEADVRLNWAWGESDSETKQAIDNLVEQGCDVIFTATYSKYAIEYCEQIGVKVIGLSYNIPELAPKSYLTGSFYNLTTFLIDVLRTVRYDTSKSLIYTGGINEGAVRLVEFNDNCKEGTQTLCDTLYQLCASGAAVIFSGELKDTDGNVKVEKGTSLSDSEIIAMDWFEESVTNINNYCEPVTEPVESDLTVYE